MGVKAGVIALPMSERIEVSVSSWPVDQPLVGDADIIHQGDHHNNGGDG
jgi:hypothetical protein